MVGLSGEMLPANVARPISKFGTLPFNGTTLTLAPAEKGKIAVVLFQTRNDLAGGTPENSFISSEPSTNLLWRQLLHGVETEQPREANWCLVYGMSGESVELNVGGGPTSGNLYISWTYGYIPG